MANPEITDERKGLPSASNAYRYTNCPGSWAMQKACPPLPESEEAASGTLEHAAQSGDVELDELTPEQQELVEKREDIANAFCIQALGVPLAECFVVREHRIWFKPDGVTPKFSGKIDLLAYHDGRYLIVDFKRRKADDAGINLQLRWLVALVSQRKHESISVAIVSPFIAGGGSLAHYGKSECRSAYFDAKEISELIQTPNAQRIPGDWCQYCPGKSRCPEAQGTATALALVDSNIIPALTGEKLASLLNILPTVYHVASAIEDEAKHRLTIGHEVPGYQLKPGRKITTITDIGSVYTRAMEFGITNEQFVSACKVTKKTMTDFIRGRGLKGKAVDDKWNDFCQGATETKNAAPSLEKTQAAIQV